jgi:hypothetical protein
MTSLQYLKQLWAGLAGLVAQLQAAKYWTDRRDACEHLLAVARQAVVRLRQAAADKDPDVAHWGKQAVERLRKDLSGPEPADLAALDHELTKLAKDAELAAPADSAAPGSVRELLDWLAQFARTEDGAFEPREAGGRIAMPLPEGRKQTIHVDLGKTDSQGRPVALFYSICGEAQSKDFQWALEANAALSRGAFAIIGHKDRHMLIMMLRRRIEELAWETLPKKIRYLAHKADWAESHLQPQDKY